MNPMFTRRHYKAIAKALGRVCTTKETYESIVELFKSDNARFNEEKFYYAIKQKETEA